MGPSDQDVNYSLTAQSKTVTIPAFYMDHSRSRTTSTVSSCIGCATPWHTV